VTTTDSNACIFCVTANIIDFHLDVFASFSLQLDFDNFEWVDDDSFSQTSTEARQRQ